MFGRKKKLPPRARGEFFDLAFDERHDLWTLRFRGTDFLVDGRQVDLPAIADLERYLGWIDAHRSHIDAQVADMAAAWTEEGVDASRARIASIAVEAPGRILVTVLGDETWGDLGYDLRIDHAEIIDESVSD